MRRAAFLDRDGVINLDIGYVHRWEDFFWTPRALEALKKLSCLGFTIIIVTNQSGIGRGLYSVATFHTLMKTVVAVCAANDIEVHYYFCPHSPTDALAQCNCRKPQPGMLLAARDELDIDLTSSIMIGDRTSDLEAAKNAGVPTRFLIQESVTAHDPADRLSNGTFKTLWDCVNSLESIREPTIYGITNARV